jgi:predicted nucleic acid-binding protein
MLADALDGVTSIGIDTTVFIYFIERHPLYVDALRDLFQRVHDGSIEAHTSTVTLIEVLTRPKQLGQLSLEHTYRSLLVSSAHLSLHPVDASVAELAADFRAHFRLRTPDAIQVAVAVRSGCDAFLTNDIDLRRVTAVPVVLLADHVT